MFGGEEEKPVEEKPVFEKAENEKPAEEKAGEEKNTGQAEKLNESEQKVNETSKNETEKTAPKETKPKVVTLKEPIKSSEEVLTIITLNKQQFAESLARIEKLDKIEKEINRRATALNNLESFVIDVQNKLYEDEYAQSGTEEEIEKIRTACSEVSDWLYEDGSDADADTYEKKLDSLYTLTKDLFSRVYEHKERPEALKALHSMLNHSSHFLASAKNLTKAKNPDKEVYTEVEIETLDKVIKETSDWRDKLIKEQEALKKYEPIKLTVKMLVDKMAALDREVKYLINKLKIWKPKKVEKPISEKTENNTENNNTKNDKTEVNKQEESKKEETQAEEPTLAATQEDEKVEEITPTETDQSDDQHSEL